MTAKHRSGRELDRFDIALLNLVQEDNQLATKRVAEKIGLSATACQRRLTQLREDGVIAADVAILAPEAIRPCVTLVVLVSLEREQLDFIDGFKRRIAACPEVTQCYYVTGNADFILVVRLPTMEAYETFTKRVFFSDRNIKSFQTFASMQTVKFTTKVALPPG